MARFIALNTATRLLSTVGSFGVLALASAALSAAPTASTNAAPAQPAPPAVAKTPPAPQPNKPPAAAPVAAQEDSFNQYGKILAPGNEPSHPIKLALPLSDVGEIKIPSQDELTMREKLEQLATLSDDEIRQKLNAWPPFTKMSLKDQGMMLVRIQDFRERRARIAMDKAHDIGLLTLTKPQQAEFEKEYWSRRLPMERDLVKQIAPLVKAREQKMQEELYRKFSSLGQPPVAQNQPAPPKPQDKPAPQPNQPPKPAPTAQAKPDKPADKQPQMNAMEQQQMNPAPMR